MGGDGRSIVVLGAGIAGLATALLLVRDGNRVTLVERDEVDAPATDGPDEAFGWERRGIAHFLQPHAFIPRGRVELMASLPDVYDRLIEAGAREVDTRRKMPGAQDASPADADLQYLAVRRPVLEWALRAAVLAEPGVRVRTGAAIEGLRVQHGRVTGVAVGGSVIDGDLVVDALGRRSPTGRWLDEAGTTGDACETSDCGVVYYSRYYRVTDGSDLPDGPWILSPRGDLGYLGYASFPGDNRTFAALLSVPSGVPEWRAFGDAEVFEAAVSRIPSLRLWVDPARVEPITDVMPMAGLRNTLRGYGESSAPGLVPVGDAFSHTDPVLAHGLAFALVHARELAAVLRNNDAAGDAGAAYCAATAPALRQRFDLATALDDQRRRMWVGEPVDFAHRNGAYALFSVAAAGAVAMVDPEVFRMFVRRMGLLDETSVLDDDEELLKRIEETFQQMLASPRPPSGPTRDEMVALTSR